MLDGDHKIIITYIYSIVDSDIWKGQAEINERRLHAASSVHRKCCLPRVFIAICD